MIISMCYTFLPCTIQNAVNISKYCNKCRYSKFQFILSFYFSLEELDWWLHKDTREKQDLVWGSGHQILLVHGDTEFVIGHCDVLLHSQMQALLIPRHPELLWSGAGLLTRIFFLSLSLSLQEDCPGIYFSMKMNLKLPHRLWLNLRSPRLWS